LANFYKFVVIPNEAKIISYILINYLKEYLTKKCNENENNKLMISVLKAFVNISTGDNKKVLFDGGMIPLLLPLVNSSDTNLLKKTVIIISNICSIESVEDKNSIINCGIFDVFHKILLEILPVPPQKRILSNCYSVYRIILGIDNLLIFNSSGVISFFKKPLIPPLLHILDLRNTSNNRRIQNIFLCICRCFLRCTEHCYEDTLLLIEMKVVDSLLNIIEMYNNKIKNNKILLNEKTVQILSMIFFNIGLNGSKAGSKEEINKFKVYFSENNRLSTLFNLFKHLISESLSPIQKDTINWISVGICFLLKNERPPIGYGCLLKYVNNLKSSPSAVFNYNFPLAAKEIWDAMLNADECFFNNCLFEEIVVHENFKVKNGLFGLERDIYLSIVKFLGSSTVRKV
jgi:hypothetical protein